MYVLSLSCLVSGGQMTDTYDLVLNSGMSRCVRKILEGKIIELITQCTLKYLKKHQTQFEKTSQTFYQWNRSKNTTTIPLEI